MANNTTTKLTIFINGKEVERSLNGMGKELKELNKEVRGLNEGDPNFRRKSQELTKLREEYNRLRGEVYGANNATNNFTSGLKGVGAGIAAAFTVDQILQFGQQIYQVVDQMRELNTEVSQLTGLTGPQLDQVTARTQSISDVFKKDSKEILLAANAFTILTDDINVSLDFLKNGFQEGIDASGEMLSSVKEYAPFIKEAGGDANDLMNILRTSTVDGVFNDKGIDAVKEFTLRVREMTPATKKAFDTIGISSDEMTKKIASGEMSIMDVMDKVSKRMSELPADSQAVGVAMADIWGGPGEDAGYKFLANLHKIGDATKELTVEQQAYVDLTEKQLEVSDKWNQVWLKFTDSGGELAEVFTEVKGALADVVLVGIELSEWMIKNNGSIESLRDAWESYYSTLQSLKFLYETLYKSIENVAVALGFTSDEVETFMSHIASALNPLKNFTDSIERKAMLFNILSMKVADTVSDISALVSTVRDLIDVMSELDMSKLMDFNPSKVFNNHKKNLLNNDPVEVLNNLMPSSLTNRNNNTTSTTNSTGLNTKPTGSISKNRINPEVDIQKKEAEQLHKELLKERENYEKKNKELSNKYDQEKIDAMRDGIQKELDQNHHNTVLKIEALNEEIETLEQLQQDYRDKADKLMTIGTAQAKKDAVEFRKLADEQVNIINWKNSSIKSAQEKGVTDELKIYSKYRGLEVQQRQKANDDFINDLKTSYNNELAEITTLEEAKKVLKEKYGVENVNQLDTITDARNEVLKEQNKKLLQEQLGAFEVELQEIQNLINSDDIARGNGLQVLTDEDRDKQIENLKNLGAAISEVKVQLTNDGAGDDDETNARNASARKQILSGIDIFGFSADDWETAFEGIKKAEPGLEKLSAKLKLTEMALQAVANAWGMMISSQNEALDRQVIKYEETADAKSIALKKQLDEGYISQETYNAQIEALEEDLAARKSEIAYKQAMNEWTMQLGMAASNTALGITKALASTAPPYSYVLAGITGAMGLMQTSMLLANKPNRGSYALGGPTVGIGYTDETGHEVAGTVHANEYVVPEWLRADPVVARMEEFIEARRTGGNPILNPTNSYANGGVVSSVNPSDSNFKDLSVIATIVEQFNQNLQLNNQFLEYLITNGVELQMDMKAAQRLNNQLETTKKFINQAKKS